MGSSLSSRLTEPRTAQKRMLSNGNDETTAYLKGLQPDRADALRWKLVAALESIGQRKAKKKKKVSSSSRKTGPGRIVCEFYCARADCACIATASQPVSALPPVQGKSVAAQQPRPVQAAPPSKVSAGQKKEDEEEFLLTETRLTGRVPQPKV
jgi:hypothetical protein